MPQTIPEDRKIVLLRLLKGELDADSAAAQLGVSRAQLRAFRRGFLRSKLPKIKGRLKAPVAQPVEVLRDRWGIPHVTAATLEDGYSALGYVMAQERLWQLDFLRRQAHGRLAEVLGPEYVVHDRLHRTIGLTRSARASEPEVPEEVGRVLQALASGINAGMEAAAGNLPVEFDLLDYKPEPWMPVDSIAVWKWRWWMLTGRLGVLSIAEAVRRHLSPDLLDLFMSVEAGEETIVPSDEPAEIGGHDTVEGSNNWVVGAGRTASGAPILATDPHNAVSHPSQWFEAQLTVPGIDAIGAFYLGTPGIYLGHTRRTAWGVTNHTASARDLYRETVSQDNPDLYLEDGEWVAFDVEQQKIGICGQAEEILEIRRTVRGPIMNDFLPEVDDRPDPPLSMAWMGSEPTTGFDSLLGLLRSQSLEDVVSSLEKWPFPILNMVFADADGRIGYHAVGRVPVRKGPWLGYRPTSDPEHAWNGVYAFSEMPHEMDPDRDWVVTANNPPWGGRGPYLTLGSWADGYRARRIRHQIEAVGAHTIDTVGNIQADSIHGRAEALAPLIAEMAKRARNRTVREMGELLEAWDCDYSVDATAPTVFTAFWEAWLRRVAAARFPEDVVSLVVGRGVAVANGLLTGEVTGWLPKGRSVEKEVAQAMKEAIEWLKKTVGPRKSQWRWGRLHTVKFSHPISSNAALAETFDLGPFETAGGNGTVRASGFSTSTPFRVTGVSTYRMVVDLSDPAHGKATTTGGQSGHPGSPHYGDQSVLWAEDEYHPLLMDEKDIRENLEAELQLVPE